MNVKSENEMVVFKQIPMSTVSKSAKRKKIQLFVQHIKELEHHPELALEIDNLETLCVDCHNKEYGTTFKNKPNKWENDEKW